MKTTKERALYTSLRARDPRNDGRFYFGVTTTGIYCRPICPAKPKFENVVFFKSKAEAEKAGFRPCLRCKPDLSPLSQRWKGTAALMSRALSLVERGDQSGESLESIADRLGMTDRHLRRLFQEHLGASPIEFAISRRLHLARQLLSQSDLSIIDIAMASGFHSLRRFNDAFVKTYQKSPRDFRKEASQGVSPEDVLRIDLPYAAPYDWENLMGYFQRHAAFGIDFYESAASTYLRHFQTPHGPGFFRVSHQLEKSQLRIELKTSALEDIRPVIEKIRLQLDLGHNPHHIEGLSSPAAELQATLSEVRGMRVPGAFDPFEAAVSIILSQLVSIERAREGLKQLILKYGTKVENPWHPSLTHLFPAPSVLKNADFLGLGFTQARAGAIRELARQVDEGSLILSPASDLEATRAQLLQIKGIGPWTVEMIALRCLWDANAFPAKDLIIARALDKFALAEEFLEPWRAYLALAIWKTQAHVLSKKGPKP